MRLARASRTSDRRDRRGDAGGQLWQERAAAAAARQAAVGPREGARRAARQHRRSAVHRADHEYRRHASGQPVARRGLRDHGAADGNAAHRRSTAEAGDESRRGRGEGAARSQPHGGRRRSRRRGRAAGRPGVGSGLGRPAAGAAHGGDADASGSAERGERAGGPRWQRRLAPAAGAAADGADPHLRRLRHHDARAEGAAVAADRGAARAVANAAFDARDRLRRNQGHADVARDWRASRGCATAGRRRRAAVDANRQHAAGHRLQRLRRDQRRIAGEADGLADRRSRRLPTTG